MRNICLFPMLNQQNKVSRLTLKEMLLLFQKINSPEVYLWKIKSTGQKSVKKSLQK